MLELKTPTPAAERLFEASFNTTLDRYRQLLTQVGNGQPDLPNENFDTGAITGPGTYRLNDETHAQLLNALAKQNFSGASVEVRAELLEFYGHTDAPYTTKRKPKDWARVQAELEQLKRAAPPVFTPTADTPVQPGLSDNRGAGASLGHQIKDAPDRGQMRVRTQKPQDPTPTSESESQN